MIVGVCKIDLVLYGGESLKDKRRVLRKIKDSILSAFKIPISEVDHQDLWQRTSLGFAVVGNSRSDLNALIDKICNRVVEISAPKGANREFEFIDYE